MVRVRCQFAKLWDLSGYAEKSKVVVHLPDPWLNWNLEMLVFEERGKPEYPEKTSMKICKAWVRSQLR